jgi:hypothetical protein
MQRRPGGLLLRSVRLGVFARRILGVLFGVEGVGMRYVGMMRCLLVVAGFVVLCRFAMVMRSLGVMMRCILVMRCCLL